MKFGVIVCPSCNKTMGVDLSYKTRKCTNCGKKLTINKLKILYKTESQEKLRQTIGLINAKFDGNLNDFIKIIKNINK